METHYLSPCEFHIAYYYSDEEPGIMDGLALMQFTPRFASDTVTKALDDAFIDFVTKHPDLIDPTEIGPDGSFQPFVAAETMAMSDYLPFGIRFVTIRGGEIETYDKGKYLYVTKDGAK